MIAVAATAITAAQAQFTTVAGQATAAAVVALIWRAWSQERAGSAKTAESWAVLGAGRGLGTGALEPIKVEKPVWRSGSDAQAAAMTRASRTSDAT